MVTSVAVSTQWPRVTRGLCQSYCAAPFCSIQHKLLKCIFEKKSSWFHPFKILINSACCTSVFPRVFFLLSHILRQIWLKSIVQFPMSIHLKISPKTKTHSWSNRLNDFLKVASLIRVALETLFCGKSSWGMEQEDGKTGGCVCVGKYGQKWVKWMYSSKF